MRSPRGISSFEDSETFARYATNTLWLMAEPSLLDRILRRPLKTQSAPKVEPTKVDQGEGRSMLVVAEGPGRTAADLVRALGLSAGSPVILVIGGAGGLDDAMIPPLVRLFERGLLRAASAAEATILDGGTDSGVIRAVGQAKAATGLSAHLVGVAPALKVTYPSDDRPTKGTTDLEPNHDGVILARAADYGGETPLLFEVLDVLMASQPAVAVVANGGDVTLAELILAAKRRIPIVAISGSGGKADELLSAAADESAEGPLADVAAAVDISAISLDADPSDLQRRLTRILGGDVVLADAWAVQRLISDAAKRQQKTFYRVQVLVLGLGLLLTFLVVVEAVQDNYALLATAPAWFSTALYATIILLPIIVAALTAATGRWRPGSRWILLRGGSETIKRDIYRYRTRSGIYSDKETKKKSAELKLSEAVGSARGGLMRTDVSQLDLDPGSVSKPRRWRLPRLRKPAWKPSGDNKMTRLSAEGYVRYRIADQIAYYTRRAGEVQRRGGRVRAIAIAIAGVGSFLAAVGLQIWVAVTTAFVGLLLTIIETRQLETSAAFFNQAAADLDSLRGWWNALPDSEQESQETIDRLVDRAERIMRAEHSGWVQDMQDAITEDRLQEASGGDGDADLDGTATRRFGSSGPRRTGAVRARESGVETGQASETQPVVDDASDEPGAVSAARSEPETPTTEPEAQTPTPTADSNSESPVSQLAGAAAAGRVRKGRS